MDREDSNFHNHPGWMISLFSSFFIIPIAITSAVFCCNFKLDSKPPVETLNSWGCTKPWRILLETLIIWLHIGNYLESCKPDLNPFNLHPSHQEQLMHGLLGTLLKGLFFYSVFNTDAITVCFPGMKSTNPQTFLLLFLTAILDHYTFGEKSPNISNVSYFSYSQILKRLRKKNKKKKEKITFNFHTFPLANTFHLQLPYRTQIRHTHTPTHLFFLFTSLFAWASVK